ncbi:hypothetical protein SD70_28105 [Gordoniibacillus kamchatkensis]|uniref:Uncharacterized protein n=1 Tax=Gordoniibacillus kamchatkensis TaxID=1590651 RepID=A0ABR5AAV5_9BACL|nr:hypothetical protein [Paenibacillus sp. VKM B-2647]KIL38190.1 hypothetical protein SD70_28105 [Paenibacillus sp. VKM B-2647]
MTLQSKDIASRLKRNFPVIEPFLTEAGFLCREKIGESTVTLIQAQGLMEVLRLKLAENPIMLIKAH